MENLKFVAVFWDEEDRYSVGTSKSLLGSNSENLQPGEATMAKFGKGRYPAHVLKFSDNEQLLKEEVANLYSEFKNKREQVEDNYVPEMEESEDEIASIQDNLPVIAPPLKRKKNIDDQPTKVRKELNFEKKEREAARQEANREATLDLLVSQRCRQLEEKVAGLERTVAALTATNSSLVSSINGLRDDLGGVLQRASCRNCMKLHIKNTASRTPEMVSPPLFRASQTLPATPAPAYQIASPPPTSSFPIASPPAAPVYQVVPLPEMSPATELEHAPAPPLTTPNESSLAVISDNGSVPNVDHHSEEALGDSSDGEELSYLGDAKYGIRLRTIDLRRCENSSSSGDKLALSLLEFLVTTEECRNMSIYGHHKDKIAMDSNKRRALRSHVFASYYLDKSTEEKEKIWLEKIVTKLNDKIRGIKNGKYKSLAII